MPFRRRVLLVFCASAPRAARKGAILRRKLGRLFFAAHRRPVAAENFFRTGGSRRVRFASGGQPQERRNAAKSELSKSREPGAAELAHRHLKEMEIAAAISSR